MENGLLAIAFAATFMLIAMLFTRLKDCEEKHTAFEHKERRLAKHIVELHQVASANRGSRKILLTPIADLLEGTADSAVEYDPKVPGEERRRFLARARQQREQSGQ